MEYELDDSQSFTKELRRDSNINAFLLMGFWAIYFTVSFVLPSAVRHFIPDTESALFSNTVTLAFYVLLYPVGFPLLFLLFRILNRNHKNMKILECFRKPQMPFWWVVKWIFLTIGATYAAAMVSSLIFSLIEKLSGFNLTEAEMSSDKSLLGIMTTLIAAPVFAPVFEEFFFRGTLYRNVRKYGNISMLIIGGLTFGLWHANYPQFLFAMSMGIFSCFLYEKTKSIIPSMTVHFLINSMGAFMTVLLGQLGLESKEELNTIDVMSMFSEHPFIILFMSAVGLGMIVFLITWLVLLIVEIACHRESFSLSPKHPEISEKKKFVTYMTAPGMLIIMTAMLVLTVLRALGFEF